MSPVVTQSAEALANQPAASAGISDSLGNAASLLGGVMDTGGAGGPMGIDPASRKFHAVSAAGETGAIKAHGESNLYAQLLQQARGGFA